MKKSTISLIFGTFVFVLMIGMELVSNRMYHAASLAFNQNCEEHSVEPISSVFECLKIKSATDTAFSGATSTHILTYMAIFFALILPAMRIYSLEKRLKELEDRTNA